MVSGPDISPLALRSFGTCLRGSYLLRAGPSPCSRSRMVSYALRILPVLDCFVVCVRHPRSGVSRTLRGCPRLTDRGLPTAPIRLRVLRTPEQPEQQPPMTYTGHHRTCSGALSTRSNDTVATGGRKIGPDYAPTSARIGPESARNRPSSGRQQVYDASPMVPTQPRRRREQERSR